LIVVIVAAVGGGAWLIFNTWADVKSQSREHSEQATPHPAPVAASGSDLPGMPPSLEPALEAARKSGASVLKNFLARYNHSIRDPRLASIELDYVVLVASRDAAEAKKYFAKVKSRTPTSSPVYPRVQQLEKSYD